LLASIQQLLLEQSGRCVFEIGCGNGSAAAFFSQSGFHITGVDVSHSGISIANQCHPSLSLFLGSAYDDLVARYGQFPVVISLEVIEHLYDPRKFAKTAFDLLLPGGTLIISTPYHGYWKNLAIAVVGKSDLHYDPLWDHGHIKFWSERTLSVLLSEAGLVHHRFLKVGRSLSAFGKSMIAIAKRPQATETSSDIR
jgi:2-polyprenyl-6-hydroxyphenyl methylase/3-demethylubiquinone-9 3-methyltransferase